MIPNEVTPVSAGTLVLRARAGDGAAWEALTARYSGMLWAIARSYRLCRADAADVVQLTWLRLVENLGALRDPERIGAWLAVTARREAVRAARGAAVRVEAEWNAIPDPATPPDEHVAARERLRTVMAAIETLPQLCQQTLRLFAASLSYAEVAAALGIPLGSVGPARTRCLAALRKLLGGAA